MKIQLRPVHPDDCLMLWEWANEPQLRALSFCSQAILWEDHKRWFRSKVKDKNCLFLIAENTDGEAIGQVRFDISMDEAIISLGVALTQRGKGYGSLIVRLASQRVFDETDVDIIHAYLKPSNQASRRIFEKAGYCKIEKKIIKGQIALHFALDRDKLS